MKKFFLSAVALVAAIAFNSFREAPKESKGDGNVINSYFRFANVAATESNLETITNWTYESDATMPPTPTCGGAAKVCISHVLPSAAGIDANDTDADRVEKFRDFLVDQNGETGELANALAYIDANTDAKQP